MKNLVTYFIALLAIFTFYSASADYVTNRESKEVLWELSGAKDHLFSYASKSQEMHPDDQTILGVYPSREFIDTRICKDDGFLGWTETTERTGFTAKYKTLGTLNVTDYRNGKVYVDMAGGRWFYIEAFEVNCV